MTELEQVERAYRELTTKLIYDSFRGVDSSEDQRRLDDLTDRRVSLSAPDLYEVAGAR